MTKDANAAYVWHRRSVLCIAHYCQHVKTERRGEATRSVAGAWRLPAVVAHAWPAKAVAFP